MPRRIRSVEQSNLRLYQLTQALGPSSIMFNNSSNIDASHSTFSEIHRDQYYNVRSTVQGNQTIHTIIHGNQIIQDSHSSVIAALHKATAPSAAHDSAERYPAPKCIEGTRTELLTHLTSWVDEPDKKPICWLNGRPGSGKSAVLQTIAEKYASQQRLAASFFFSRRDVERRTTQHVIPTLTTQLLGILPSIRPAVVAALESDYMIPMKVLREQMEKLLIGPLSTASETPEASLLIVIDALDECDDESLVSELITLLTRLPSETSLPLRLLITSRAEPWLQSRFHRTEISTLTFPLDIHAFSAEEDIRSFLRLALDDTYEQHLQVMKDVPRPWPPSDELECLVNRADGLFVFALTVVKFVGDKVHSPFQRLQAILGDKGSASDGSAYADLDSLYRDAISVFPDADIVRLVLGIVYCTAIPLSISGLHKLLQRPDVDARLVVPALSSVLLASEDGAQPIQFYHASFRDFLINPQRSKKYAINPDVYHRLMAQLCFEIMSKSLKRDMCQIGDPAKANSEVPDLVERRQTAFNEALLYACRFWARHLARIPSDGVTSEALLGVLKSFSTTVLLCWIEALSIFGELEKAVVILREAIRWLKTLPEVPEDVLTLLEDADRLVVLHMDCISECALHVHLTAISLVPTKTAIYKTFKHQSFGNLTVYPERADEWDALRTSFNLRNAIHSIALSPNGDMIAAAGVEHGVQVWNVITGRNIASLGNRSSTSLLVRFSPSCAFLAAGFEGGTVAIWDPKVGREHLKHEDCHKEPITCLEFSENSALLASGSRDHAIQVWSVEMAQALYRLATHEGPVTSLVFSNDSLKLISGSEDNLIIIWDMSTGKLVRGMMGHRKAVNCVAVSKDGNILASGSEDKTIKLWDASLGKCTQTFSKGHHSGIRSVRFFDQDRHVVAACDGTIISWDVASRNTSHTIWTVEQFYQKGLKFVHAWQANVIGWVTTQSMLRFLLHRGMTEPEALRQIVAHAIQLPSFVFSNATHMFAGSLQDPVSVIPLNSMEKATAVAISSDGIWAASSNALGSVRVFDLTRRSQGELGFPSRWKPLRITHTLIPSPDSTRFIIDNLLQWILIDAECRVIKRIDVGMIGSARGDDDIRFKFSADGSMFFCVIEGLFQENKSSIRIFNSETGERHTQLKGLKKVHSFVASPDGAWIACGHGSDLVDVFRVASGQRTSLEGSNGVPTGVLLFTHDAQELVGGFKTGAVRVWDRASGACKATFEMSTSMVTALAYAGTHGGARVAIGREDGSLCLWSPSTSASHQVLRADEATAKHVAFIQFSDDLSRLMSRGTDETVFSWAIPFDPDDTRMERCALCASEDAERPTSLPHLASRTDPEDVVDRFFHMTYRVRKDGWLVKGDRRMIWFPPSMRPRKETFYAYENGQVVFCTAPMELVFLQSPE